MTRGNAFIYKTLSQRPQKSYQAPFDTILFNSLSSSKLLKVEVLNEDRILRFICSSKSSYKDKKIILQLEFTGKNTNAILLNEDKTIVEALRHIDSNQSFRVIRPGVELLNIPPFEIKEEEKSIENIDEHLENIYNKLKKERLIRVKKQKRSSVEKQYNKLIGFIKKLPSSNQLKEEQTKYNTYANLILANLRDIKSYDTKLKTYDFNGEEITIKFPKNIKVNRLSDYYFSLAKRAKNKMENIYKERESLNSKKEFYENILFTIDKAKTTYELELLVPTKGKSERKKEKLKDGVLFWIEDYKVFVGRNSQENQHLLSIAKANDMWMHIKNIPSSHVIIRTDKQNLPKSVIESCAKLCVDFSVKNAGEYEVDYTKRKFVKIQEGSNVFYNKYETIKITKEGIEIRE